MNSITKGIVGVIVIGALAAAIGAIAQKQSTGDKNSGQIKVGAILPLSGDLAALGEEVKRGIELAAEDAKMEGANVAVIYEDDRYTPAMDVSAANKLINVDKVDAAMTMFVEEAKPMAPVFNTSKTPLVALWDSNEFIKSNEYLFSNGFSTERAGEAMAEYAYDKLGMRTAAIHGQK